MKNSRFYDCNHLESMQERPMCMAPSISLGLKNLSINNVKRKASHVH